MTVRVPFARILFAGKVSLLLCFVFLAQLPTAASGLAQPYTIKNWQTEDGLPQATPRAIIQTRDGYLWIGTFNGLARFDGIQFRSFTINNTPEFKSDQINTLFEDRAGNLWIGASEGGLVRYRDGTFTPVQSSSNLSVNAICEDFRGSMFIASSGGIHTLVDGELAPHGIAGLSLDAEVIALIPASNDVLWIGTRWTLHRTRVGAVLGPPLTFREEVHDMELDERDRPWVAFSNAGLGFAPAVSESSLDPSASEPLTFTVLPHRFKANAMHRGRDRALWLGTYGGQLLQLQPGTTNSFQNFPGIEKHPITSVFEDADGHLWLGMASRGIFQLRKKVVATLGVDHGLLSAEITSICEDRHGNIWAGTFGKGLHLWDPREQRFQSVRRDAQNVTTLLPDRNGNLWFGRFGGSLGRRNNAGRFEYPSEYGMRARTLFEDREGGLWIGTFENGVEYRKDGKVRRYSTREGLFSDHIQVIAQDSVGGIWIGTSHGLNRLHHGRMERYDRSDGLGGNEVRALFSDSEGTLWIGSTGGGLTRWRDGVLRSIGTKEGLINDWIEQILEDNDGNLWLGSNGGLMRVSLKELNECASGAISLVHCRFFGRSDGLSLPHCGTGFQPSSLRASDGTLWFGTDAGILLIDPKQIKSNTNAPAVYIEALHADNRTLRIQARSTEKKRLPAGTQRLEFRYTALDFSAPAKIRFRYKLEGLDADWVSAGMDRGAIYSRVPPGEYRFHVSAANNHGVWNDTGASLALSIAPYFWQTGLFQGSAIAGALAASGLLSWALLTRKHRRELKSLADRHALEQERARIARDIHDGVGASLVKISLLGDLALRQFDGLNHSRDQVRKMTSTARQVLRDMDEIVWAVDPKNDSLENFATYLCHFANEHFQDTSIACHLDLPPELPAVTLSANTRHNLLLATQEALNNVLKHSSASKARISLRLLNSMLQVEIEDNGQCPMKKGLREGNGIKNIQQRLNFIGGSAIFTEVGNGGTHVRLAVRINESL